MTTTLALELAIQLLTHSQQISALIANAQAAGRTELTDEEWQQVLGGADEAESALTAAIAKAKAEGR